MNLMEQYIEQLNVDETRHNVTLTYKELKTIVWALRIQRDRLRSDLDGMSEGVKKLVLGEADECERISDMFDAILAEDDEARPWGT